MIHIAIDAMGGDNAPKNEVLGAIEALRRSGNRFEVVLIGRERALRQELETADWRGLNISVVQAEEVIGMDDAPTAALRSKRDSSIVKGLEMHRDRLVDAFVSAGNTGAVMSASTLILGRIPGVARPTIGAVFPTEKGLTIVVDVGASVDCKPRHLYEFGVMGSIYAAQIFHCENPRVALLNIGEEETKGNEAVLGAYELLKNSSINFVGNIEGRDILRGTVEVVVCDGFTGNVVLKFAESVLGVLKAKFRAHGSRSPFHLLWVAAMSRTMRRLLKDFDYQEHGGVPLLGVRGVTIIGHGRSTPKAFANMILKAEEMAEKRIDARIENALKPAADRVAG